MGFKDQSIKRKTMTVMMLTTITVLLLCAAGFTLYDLATYRESLARSLTATAAIIAEHGADDLAAGNKTDAQATLSLLHTDPRVAAAALYDSQGRLLAHYPPRMPISLFPAYPEHPGHRFEGARLILFQPVMDTHTQLGTLYIVSDPHRLFQRLRVYGSIVSIILLACVLAGFVLSLALERRITRPILALAGVARTISERGDYTIRAQRVSRDETGLLTDAFNAMLARIQSQTAALRQSEQSRSFLAAIVESSDDAIVGKDLSGKVVSWNAGAERMFGYTAAEMLGQPVTRLLSPDRPDEEQRAVEAATRGETSNVETVRVRKDGTPVDISLTLSPIRNGDAHVIGISSIARDITERKRAEQQILHLNAELEQRVQARTQELSDANHELESFTYSVAHDLRAPLRHVDAFARILHEDFGGTLPPDGQLYLGNIRRSAAKMSQLVDDLLNLSRVGRQELKRHPTELSSLVEEAIADLKNETNGRNINWQIAPLPVAECDSGLMKQVFANLLSNAVKYTRPREQAVIEIGSVKNNGNPAVFVRDNGVGFNMKYADKLFGVFQRLHRAEEFEGTGVGLATVERIIRKHGGSIWAEAEENHGATFYFTLAGMRAPAPEPLEPSAA